MSIPSISPQILYQWLKENRVTLIDIREASEFTKERLPGAYLYPSGQIALGEFADHHPSIGVFYCRSGHRTTYLAPALTKAGFKECYQLAGGLKAWKKAGLPLVKNSRLMPDLTDQLLLLIGILITLSILWALFTPFRTGLFLCGFVGLSLIIAALTDSIILKAPLLIFPRNKNPRYIWSKKNNRRP